jgi:hypothetical protein
MGLLDLKVGVTGGNTPLEIYLVALERLCGNLRKVPFRRRSTHRKTMTCPKINLNMKDS